MASSITLLALALLPLLAARADSPPLCVFPFIFGGKSYSSCLADGFTTGDLWCATTDNYDRDHRWKLCSLLEYDGNSGGQPCVFPFSYKRETYYTCTNKIDRNGRYWCATTGNYDEDKKWSFCADIRLDANPKGPCIFPFMYEGKSYSTCTSDGMPNAKLWCSLTSDYNADAKWTYCDSSENAPCVFPFTFEKKSYSSCTTAGTLHGPLWCATTANYDKDRKWKTCAVQEYGGNSEGKPCVFPFNYKGWIYYGCTDDNEESGRLWCATTKHYDEDMKWSYCADNDRKTVASEKDDQLRASCVFPFTYKGNSYYTCISTGVIGWGAWCSLTSNYDVDKLWKYCDPSDYQEQQQ